jgi:hypothetical protein
MFKIWDGDVEFPVLGGNFTRITTVLWGPLTAWRGKMLGDSGSDSRPFSIEKESTDASKTARSPMTCSGRMGIRKSFRTSVHVRRGTAAGKIDCNLLGTLGVSEGLKKVGRAVLVEEEQYLVHASELFCWSYSRPRNFK